MGVKVSAVGPNGCIPERTHLAIFNFNILYSKTHSKSLIREQLPDRMSHP